MDAARFRQLTADLDADGLRRIGVDAVLRLVDDERLAWGHGGEPDVIVTAVPDGVSPRAWLDAEAERLVADYYRTHPLTRRGFDRQVAGLFAQHGAASFTAPAGGTAALTLFVDGGCVVAEDPASPRHRYGAGCDLQTGSMARDAAGQAKAWLEGGEAYAQYLGMNVCRYSC